MISRLRRATVLAFLFVAAAILTAACQKVPLLAPSGSSITLTASATALPSNGTTDIIAQVIEASGTPPHSGTLITFTTNLGSVQPSSAETDIAGRVVVKYIAGGGSGTATITAISGGVSASGTNAIKIAVGSAAVGSVALSANPTSLSANGGTTTITATVSDGSGNTLPGVPVTFTTDNGSLATSVVTTDSNGRAQTTLTTSRTAKVTASAGVPTTSGTTTTPAATNTITVNVNGAATVAFSAITPNPGIAGQPVSMTLTVTPATTGASIQNVVVNFGDGRVQTLGAVSGATVLSHTYDSPGIYTVTATVTDTNGDQFTGVASVSVSQRPKPSVGITASPAAPQPNQPVTFTATVTQGTTGATTQSVQWDFGDGTPPQTLQGNGTVVQHVYQRSGTFVVTATATDSTGASGSGSTIIVVGTGSADFTFSPSNPAHPATVNFSGANSSAPTQGATIVDYLWNFGNGDQHSSGSNPNASTIFATAGTFNVTLTITDSAGAKASTTKPVTVS